MAQAALSSQREVLGSLRSEEVCSAVLQPGVMALPSAALCRGSCEPSEEAALCRSNAFGGNG